MKPSESTDNQSENRSEALKNWAEIDQNQAKAVEAYENVICTTAVPGPERYNIMIKGKQFNLSKTECIRLYRSLLQVLPYARETDIDTIKIAVSRALRIPARHIDSPTREDHIVEARHGAMWLARRCGMTFTEIAEAFNKVHGTVMCAVKSFDDRMSTHPKLKAKFEQLERDVKQLLDG